MNKFKEDLPESMRDFFNGSKVSPTEFQGYARGVSTSANEMGASLNTASMGTKLLQGALTGLATVGIAYAFQSILTAVDSFIHRLDRQKEKLAEAKNAYSEASSTLESLNSELASANERINELSGKKNLSFMEQQELDKLREANKLLLEQQAIAQINEREKAKDLVKENEETFKMEFGDINKVDKAYIGSNDLTDDVHFDEIKEIIPALNDIDKEIENAAGDRKDKLQELKDQLAGNLKDTDWSTALSSLNEYEQNIRSTADSNGVLSTEAKELLAKIKEYKDILWENADPETFENLKLSELLNGEKYADITDKVKELGKSMGNLTIDELKNEFPELAADCETAGISVETLQSHLASLIPPPLTDLEKYMEDFSGISDNVSGLMSTQNTLTAALNEQGFDGSLSLETYQALIEADSEYSNCIERSAGSIRLNSEAVQELNEQKKEEALNTIQVQKNIDQLRYNSLAKNLGNLTDAEREQLDVLRQNIDSYDIYIAQIEEAYSAFSDFENAKRTANQGQKQRTMENARDIITEGLTSKRTGTDDYKMAVQLYVPDTVDPEDAKAVEAYMASIAKYMNGNEESVLAFLGEAYNRGLLTEDFQLNGDVTAEEFAQKMEMTMEMIQAQLGEASEFKYDIVLSEPTDILPSPEEIQQQIDELAASLEEADIPLSADINFSTMNTDELQENIGLLQSDRSNYSVDSSEYQQINDLIAIAIERKQQLSEPAILSVSTEGLDTDLAAGIEALQNYQQALNNLERAQVLGMDTDKLQEQLDTSIAQINSLDPKVKTSLQINETTQEELNKTLDNLNPEILAQLVPVPASENTTVPTVTGQVIYNASYTEMLSKPVPQRRGIINYVGNFSGIKVPAILKVLGFANGTAHANGTAPPVRSAHWGTALSSGDWSLPHDETALTGELGQELVVRNGRYFTVGDTGPEMARLRRGDIVFNHRQTRDILSKGYAAGRGRAYASGTVSSASGDKAFEELTDWIEVLIDVFQRKVKELNRLAVDIYQKYTDQNPVLDQMAADIRSFLGSEEQLYNRYMQQADAVGLDGNSIQKIQNGTLDIETIADEDLKEKIDDYTKWYKQALNIRDTMNDLKRQLRDIAAQKLNNIVDDFKQLLDVNKSLVSYQEKYISLLEESGKHVGEGDYTVLLGEEANNIRYLNAELKTLTAEYNKLLAAGELEFDDWKEWQAALTDIETKILESEIALEKYKKEIRTIRWSGFTSFVDSLKDGNNALDDMLTLLGNSGLLDKSGISARGKTYLGLVSEQLVNSKKLAAQYKAAMETLGQELKKGTITQQEYNEELLKYQELQRQAAIDTKKAKDAILDFIKDAIDKETEAFEKLIRVKKDALRVQKQNEDYARKVSEKQKQINTVKARLAGLEGNDSAAAIQERKKLNAELKGLEEELEDIQRDRKLEVLENTYDEALKLFEEHQEDVKEKLDSDLDLQNQEIANMLAATKDSYNEIYDYLQKLADHYNAVLTDSITAPWEDGAKAAHNYYEAVNKLSAATGVDTGAVASMSKNESDIRGLYQSILGREADSSGLNDWLAKMDSGMTLSEVESGILNSREYRVKDLYRSLLGRTASDSEIQYWVNKLGSGMSLSQVSDAFKASPEYKTHANAFVNDLYKTVLGRTADSSGLNYWVQKILSGMSKKDVAKAFYGSAEYQNKYAGKSNQEYVTALYKSMLGRAPDTSGLGTYVNLLNAGKSRSEIANIILMSREFTDLKGYAKGAKKISQDQLAYVGEQGIEAIMTDKGLVTSLPGGSTVFTNGQTMELWGASKDPSAWIAENLSKALPAYSALTADTASPLTVNIESMIGNVEHVDKNSLPAYEKLLKESANYTIDLIKNNYRKLN